MKKLTIEDIREYVEENSSCKLISTEYLGNSKHLEFVCNCGEVFKTSFSQFKQRNKRQCNKCSAKSRAEKKSYTYEQIKRMVEEDTNYEYLLVELKWRYESDKRKRLLVVKHLECNKIYEVTLGNWVSGKRCRECMILRNAKKARLSKEQLQEAVEKYEDYVLKDSFTKEVEGVIKREKTFLRIYHKKCNGIFVKSLGEWTTTPKCSICSPKYSVSYLHGVLTILFKKYYDNVISEYDIGFKGEKGGISRYDLFVPKLNGVDTIFEFQSRYHDDKKEFDLKKHNFAVDLGYKVIALDHRYTDINKIIKEYFNLNEVPSWVNEELKIFKRK